jgi:hypothetical protein
MWLIAPIFLDLLARMLTALLSRPLITIDVVCQSFHLQIPLYTIGPLVLLQANLVSLGPSLHRLLKRYLHYHLS